MPTVTFDLHTAIDETPRVAQTRGLFDIAEPAPEAALEGARSRRTATLPTGERDPDYRSWNIGLITGPSGCGKSTLARHLYPNDSGLWLHHLKGWPASQSVLDGFPETMSVKDITLLLSSVGFSSPPAWLRPHHTLSTGEQFRADLARLIATAIATQHQHNGAGRPIVFDEFTSVVDRTVAKIGSAALARTVRKHNLQFVAVTCHDDVIEWLQPDWVYTPADDCFAWRSLRRRPNITLEFLRCKASAWQLFAPHHYLSHDIAPMSYCWLVTHQGRPCAFSAWITFFGTGPKARREHRTVVLPDYQGVGVGMKVSSTIASMWKALGFKAMSTTTHPAFRAARLKSDDWQMTRAPGVMDSSGDPRMKHATTRMTAGFAYVGEAMQLSFARKLFGE